MRIPFTNLRVFEKDSTGQRRPLVYGQTSFQPSRDLTGVKISFETFYFLHRRNSDVTSAVNKLKESIGLNGYQWWDFEKDEPVENQLCSEYLKTDNPALTGVSAHDYLESVLNYGQSWRTLKEKTLTDKYVTGNAYWVLLKNELGDVVIGVQRVDPRTMSIVMTQHGDVVRYIQSVAGKPNVVFEPNEVVHFALGFDPNNEGFGLSPLEGLIYDAHIDLEAQKYNYSFFANHAAPAKVIILEDGIDPASDEGRAVLKQIGDQFKGAENAHKTGVLVGVKDIKTMVAMSQKDMEYHVLRNFTSAKIASAYGMSLFILGHGSDAHYNNAPFLTSNYIENTVLPAEYDFAEEINHSFIPKLGLRSYSHTFGTAGRQRQGVGLVFNGHSLADLQAIEELKLGVITPRQYKERRNIPLDDTDRDDPNFDRHIVYQGAGARLLEDVGTDTELDLSEDTDATR